jgi:predicted unusual protein kinase regulating ubiquinone biosynthesis (AarF/ABC1/UbiB family)
MEQMLVMRLIHFDPHPGNILVTTGSRIVLLDFGMSGEITEHMQKGMLEGIQSFLLKDARAFIDMLDDQGFIRKGVNKYSLMPFIEFMLEEVFQYIRLDRESIHTVDFSPIVKDIAKIIYTEPFVIPVHWAYIGKTVGVLAGIISALSPKFKLYEGLRPHMEKVLKENASGTLRKTIEEAQENLKRLLRLPLRASSFMENLEKGYYKIQVDYSEIHEKIDEVKQFIIRLISFLIFSISGFGSYLSFKFSHLDIAYIFFGTSVISLAVAIFYRMKNQQEKIEKYFQ